MKIVISIYSLILGLIVGLILGFVLAVYTLPYESEHNFQYMVDDNGNTFIVDLNADPDDDGEDLFNPSSDVFFLLYTRNNPTNPQTLTINDSDSIANSSFNPEHPTRFYAHGWNGDGRGNTEISDAFFRVGDYNIIMVDWGRGAQTPNYFAARNRVGPVGAFSAEFIRFLSSETGISSVDITFIGFSLGAHVAGFAGKNLSSPRLGVVSALDPAGPGFSEENTEERVHSTDAEYVESIHTNGGTLGIMYPVGQASFYPKYGRSQPGCGVDLTGSCSHRRAVNYYAESIYTTVHFWGRMCRNFDDITNENCVSSGPQRRMGGDPADSVARGIFWMSTNSTPPYAQGPM